MKILNTVIPLFLTNLIGLVFHLTDLLTLKIESRTSKPLDKISQLCSIVMLRSTAMPKTICPPCERGDNFQPGFQCIPN